METTIKRTNKVTKQVTNLYKVIYNNNSIDYMKGDNLENAIELKGYNPMIITNIAQFFVKQITI